jgi:type I restriction enzyme S subunit
VQTGEVKAANLYIDKHTVTYNDFGLLQSKIWPKDTLCITIAANIAETALLSYPMCFPDSVVGFIANKEESSELFMHYVFTYIRRAIQNSASGSIQDNINIEFLTGLRFKIPTKKDQGKIVNVLACIDEAIEVNNKIQTELEAMAKLIYDYWFVQFDFPDYNGKPYKSSGGKMVYNEELKREIPDSWKANELETSGDFKNGKGINKTDFSDVGTYEVYGSNGITGKSNLPLFIEPVIAIGRVGANYGEIHYSLKPCWISDNAVTAQPKNKEWYWWLLLTLKGINYKNIAGGSAQPLITQGKLKSLLFAKPSKLLITEFYEKVNPVFLKIQNIKEKNQELIELRDWLLPMLMNGQVTVKEA